MLGGTSENLLGFDAITFFPSHRMWLSLQGYLDVILSESKVFKIFCTPRNHLITGRIASVGFQLLWKEVILLKHIIQLLPCTGYGIDLGSWEIPVLPGYIRHHKIHTVQEA